MTPARPIPFAALAARSRRALLRRARGMTLVELLVALVVALIVVLAAVAALTVSRTGSRTVDASTQLRDEARFATDIVQRLVMQAGFEDVMYSTRPYRSTVTTYRQTNPGVNIVQFSPPVYGYNDRRPSPTNPLGASLAHASAAPGAGSDTLVLQYQAAAAQLSGSNAADRSMIDCSGNTPGSKATMRDERIVSVLYVDTSMDEPALMCLRTAYDSNGQVNGWATPTPLLKGVESFQVLYGVDNVNPGAAPTGHVDSVPERYLRADELTVAGDSNATRTNWRRVRSLRIGMVLRGDPGSALETDTSTVYPLGQDFANAGDARSSYQPNDKRLRQVVTFTVNLRNCQNQGYQTSSDRACDINLPN